MEIKMYLLDQKLYIAFFAESFTEAFASINIVNENESPRNQSCPI